MLHGGCRPWGTPGSMPFLAPPAPLQTGGLPPGPPGLHELAGPSNASTGIAAAAFAALDSAKRAAAAASAAAPGVAGGTGGNPGANAASTAAPQVYSVEELERRMLQGSVRAPPPVQASTLEAQLEHQANLGMRMSGATAAVPPPLPLLPDDLSAWLLQRPTGAHHASARWPGLPQHAEGSRLPSDMPAAQADPAVLSVLAQLAAPANRPHAQPSPFSRAPRMIEPFTRAHKAALLAATMAARAVDPQCSIPHALSKSVVAQFLPELSYRHDHPNLMSKGDKELIFRIQLSQMAAMGQHNVQNYRGALLHRARRVEDTKDDGEGRAALAARLHETIYGKGTASNAAADSIAASSSSSVVQKDDDPSHAAEHTCKPGTTATSTGVSGSTQDPALKEPSHRNAPDQVPATKAAGVGAGTADVPGDEFLQSGLRTDAKFGKHQYASVHHPRKGITLDSAPGEGEYAWHPSEATSSGPAVWREHLALERAYETLLDLERVTYRWSECNLADEERRARLDQERRTVLEHALGQLFGTGANLDRHGSPNKPERIIAKRKGRVLLQRLLLCVLPAEAEQGSIARHEVDSASAPAVAFVWRLVAAVLRAPDVGCVLVPPHPTDDDSWHRLRWALARTAGVARTRHSEDSLCSEELRQLLRDPSARDKFAAMSSSRSGLALLRYLVECFGGSNASGEPLHSEDLPELLVNEVCGLLSSSLRTAPAAKGRPAPCPSDAGPGADLDETPCQEDLWAALVAIAERAGPEQRRRIRELVGPAMDMAGATSAR